MSLIHASLSGLVPVVDLDGIKKSIEEGACSLLAGVVHPFALLARAVNVNAADFPMAFCWRSPRCGLCFRLLSRRRFLALL